MDIKYAILGLLSWRQLSGYDLKKMMQDSELFYWSGNNNQIYSTLVQLHQEGMVDVQLQPQEHLPSRKLYNLTKEGKAALKQWLISEPPLPQLRKTFLIQLAWSIDLSHQEIDNLLTIYENELRLRLIMLKEQLKRGTLINPARNPREKYVWGMIWDNYLDGYQAELEWAGELRENLPE